MSTHSKFLSPFLFIVIVSMLVSCNVTDSEICTTDCFIESGVASWYGYDYPARCTANGETYDKEALTAAHKTLPFNTIVRVENLENGKRVTVRINDRGPFVPGRIIDLSQKAAGEIEILEQGLADVGLYLIKESDNPEPDFSQGCEEL
jgi:rare lipoprotein A